MGTKTSPKCSLSLDDQFKGLSGVFSCSIVIPLFSWYYPLYSRTLLSAERQVILSYITAVCAERRHKLCSLMKTLVLVYLNLKQVRMKV